MPLQRPFLALEIDTSIQDGATFTSLCPGSPQPIGTLARLHKIDFERLNVHIITIDSLQLDQPEHQDRLESTLHAYKPRSTSARRKPREKKQNASARNYSIRSVLLWSLRRQSASFRRHGVLRAGRRRDSATSSSLSFRQLRTAVRPHGSEKDATLVFAAIMDFIVIAIIGRTILRICRNH